MNKAYFDDVAVHGLEWQAPHVYRVPGVADIVAAEGAHSRTAYAAFEYLYIPIMKKGRSFLTSLHHFTEIAFNSSVPLKYKTIHFLYCKMTKTPTILIKCFTMSNKPKFVYVSFLRSTLQTFFFIKIV